MKDFKCRVDGCEYEGDFHALSTHGGMVHTDEENSHMQREILEEEFSSVAEDGEVPKFEDFREKTGFSITPIHNQYESYGDFVRSCGYDYYQWTDGEILKGIQDVSDKYCEGDRPTTSDIRNYADFSPETVQYRFGSMNKAFEKVGFDDIHYMNVPKERLLKEINIVFDKLGKRPTSREMTEYGIFSIKLFQDKFGSWNNAIAEAGYEPIPQHGQGKDNPMFGMTGEDNPNCGNTGKDNPSYIHGSPDNPHADVQYRRNRKRLMDICEGICQHLKCSKEESEHGMDLDCHHIVPHKLLPEGEKHSIENLIILCREHHAEVEPPKRCKTESQYLS